MFTMSNVTFMCRNDELSSELFPILGKIHHMGLRITEKMPKHPRGGTMFLLNTSTFNRGDHADGHQGQNIADGYMWTEILHQSDLITSKENHLDYRHYYISTSLGDGRRRRTSSKFRHSEPELPISLLFKVHIFWEGHKNFAKSPPFFWLILVPVKKRWRFRKLFVAFSEYMNFNNYGS